MIKNVGKMDKTIRIIVGSIIVLLGIYFQSWWALIGLVLIVTGLLNFCLIYTLFKINTKKD